MPKFRCYARHVVTLVFRLEEIAQPGDEAILSLNLAEQCHANHSGECNQRDDDNGQLKQIAIFQLRRWCQPRIVSVWATDKESQKSLGQLSKNLLHFCRFVRPRRLRVHVAE